MTIFEIVKNRTIFDIAREKLLTEDKHSTDKIGTVRRWESDGKLHIKKEHGWEVLPKGKEYELKEYSDPKARKSVSEKVAPQNEFNDFVDKLFNGDYKNAPGTVHLPKMNKGLLKTLGLNENTQFIFKAQYPHINPTRKAKENQLMTQEEYKEIPEVIKNTKTAYIDKDNKNFFITFEDKADPTMINKLVFNKATSGNYLVTLGKVNKRDELASRKILLVSGRS
jgi:hypothetical protein